MRRKENRIISFLLRTNLSSILFGLATIVFVYLGFDKLTRYRNSEYGDPVNAYVGGDAYNYIINSNYSNAYFTLAVLCALIAIGSLLIELQKNNNLLMERILKENRKGGEESIE